MDFELNEEQQQIKRTIREFAEAELRPHVSEWDEAARFPVELRPKFAELGVLFLLFLIGLELSLERLRALRRYVAGVGFLQFALSALAIGAGLGWLGMPGSGAIVLGLCLAMSSTAIVMQLLEEQGRSTTPVGRVALAVLLFQDLMVAPVLFGV